MLNPLFYMKSVRRQTENKVLTVTDPETGQIFCTEILKKWVEKIPVDTFSQVYLRHISAIFEIKSLTARHILDYFMMKAEFDTGIVRLLKKDRLELMKCLNISVPTYYNGIKELLRCNVIEKYGQNGWKINPEVIWKGTIKGREVELEYTIEVKTEETTE